MKCQDCRTHLHPYLDNELEVKENLAILDHLNGCPPCAGVFDMEERSWSRVRTSLVAEKAPAALRQGLPRLLQREDRRRFWTRTGRIFVPVAAAAALLVYLSTGPGTDPDKLAPENPVHQLAHDHGSSIHWAVSHFRTLDDDLRDEGRGKIISQALLKDARYEIQSNAEDVARVYQQIFGRSCKVPTSLCRRDVSSASGSLDFKGKTVQNLILDIGNEREISVYVLSKADADLHDLHLMKDVTNELKVERCKACDVVAVTEGDRVAIFVARPEDSVQPLLALVQETF